MAEYETYAVCRLCLDVNENLRCVFEPNGGWTAADAIIELLRLPVSADDIYPQYICNECLAKLEAFKLFKQQCKSQKDVFDLAYAKENGFKRFKDLKFLESLPKSSAQVSYKIVNNGCYNAQTNCPSYPYSRGSQREDEVHHDRRVESSENTAFLLPPNVTFPRGQHTPKFYGQRYAKQEGVEFLQSEPIVNCNNAEVECLKHFKKDETKGDIYPQFIAVNTDGFANKCPGIPPTYHTNKGLGMPSSSGEGHCQDVKPVSGACKHPYVPPTYYIDERTDATTTDDVDPWADMPPLCSIDECLDIPSKLLSDRCTGGPSTHANDQRSNGPLGSTDQDQDIPTNQMDQCAGIKSGQIDGHCAATPSEHAEDQCGDAMLTIDSNDQRIDTHTNECSEEVDGGPNQVRSDEQEGEYVEREVNEGTNTLSAEKKLNCSMCRKEFMWKESVNEGSTRDIPFQCPDCRKQLSSISAPITYKFVRVYRCDKCERKFKNEISLNKHRVYFHTSYKCDACLRVFRRKANFQKHVRALRMETPFNCTQCGRKFCDVRSLMRHRRTHLE